MSEPEPKTYENGAPSGFQDWLKPKELCGDCGEPVSGGPGLACMPSEAEVAAMVSRLEAEDPNE